jgi:hypothetical protein
MPPARSARARVERVHAAALCCGDTAPVHVTVEPARPQGADSLAVSGSTRSVTRASQYCARIGNRKVHHSRHR